MEILKSRIAILIVKYKNFIDYSYNTAIDYCTLGYKEFKFFLLLYSLLKFNPKLYCIEKDELYETTMHTLKNYKPIYFPRSKVYTFLTDYIRYLKYRYIFSL